MRESNRERERASDVKGKERERERDAEETDLTGIIYSALIRGRARRRASDEYQAARRRISLDHRSLDPERTHELTSTTNFRIYPVFEPSSRREIVSFDK